MAGDVKGGDKVPEELIGQAIKFVVMHEVGHTLGLRHNFKSSTMLPNDKLHDTALTHKQGLVGSVQKAAYVAAKHGVVGLTKVAGLELANSGVTCNAICPGWVLTPLVQKQIEDRAKARGVSFDEETVLFVSEKQQSNKFTTPEQIGGLAVFLCSPAADNIMGAALPIDGAWIAR